MSNNSYSSFITSFVASFDQWFGLKNLSLKSEPNLLSDPPRLAKRFYD
jgi:hypothetical protein